MKTFGRANFPSGLMWERVACTITVPSGPCGGNLGKNFWPLIWLSKVCQGLETGNVGMGRRSDSKRVVGAAFDCRRTFKGDKRIGRKVKVGQLGRAGL